MKLIAEYVDHKIEVLTEAKEGGGKNHFIEGIFMQSEQKNRNGRIYPKAIMESAVDKYVTEQVKTKRSVGELNHPEGPTVNLDKVSHLIEALDWEGNDVIGKARILDTPNGMIVKAQEIEKMETEILNAPRADLYETQVREFKNFLSMVKKSI